MTNEEKFSKGIVIYKTAGREKSPAFFERGADHRAAPYQTRATPYAIFLLTKVALICTP